MRPGNWSLCPNDGNPDAIKIQDIIRPAMPTPVTIRLRMSRLSVTVRSYRHPRKTPVPLNSTSCRSAGQAIALSCRQIIFKNLCKYVEFRNKINSSVLGASFVSFSERKSVDIICIIWSDNTGGWKGKSSLYFLSLTWVFLVNGIFIGCLICQIL